MSSCCTGCSPRDHLHAHPEGVLLVIEIAWRRELYAAARVPDCWVVDVAAKRVRVFRDPGADGYAAQTVLRACARSH